MEDVSNVVKSAAQAPACLNELKALTVGPRTILRPSYAVDHYEDESETTISVEVTFSPVRRDAAQAAMLALVERAFAEAELTSTRKEADHD